LVLTSKVAEVAPAATETVAGTVADVELEERVTIEPAEGAADFKVTVPVAETPPATDVGATEMALIRIGSMAKLAVCVAPLNEAERVATTGAVTEVVETWNDAEVVPEATVTEAGTVAEVELELNVTVVPAAGAGPSSVTVPVEGAPPKT
jgi:hypothetical protein